jgi:hypothetical protein
MYLTLAKGFRNCVRGTFVETSFTPLVGVHESGFRDHVVVTCYRRIRFVWVACFEVVDRSFKRWFARTCFAASATETQYSGREFHRKNGSAQAHFLARTAPPNFWA